MHCIYCHHYILSQFLCLQCWPNHFWNIWCSTHIVLLWAFWILDAIGLLYISLNVRWAIMLAVIWMIQVAKQVKPIFGVGNAFRDAIIIMFDWITVNCSHSVNIECLSSCSTEVFCILNDCDKGYLSANLNAAAPAY